MSFSFSIRVLSGAAAGREVALTKVVTTIGKPGVAVASITHRPHGYMLSLVEGPDMPILNGSPIGSQSMPLKSGDRLELAGTVMPFVQGELQRDKAKAFSLNSLKIRVCSPIF